MKPLVGILSSRRELETVPLPLHGTATTYIDAVRGFAGAEAVMIPGSEDADQVISLLHRLDGIVLTGGAANIQPHLFGQAEEPESGARDPARDASAITLTRAALDAGVPLLGICRGIQEVNVALGGSLHQHLKDVPGRFDHRRPRDKPFAEQVVPRHGIALRPGGMLHDLAGGATEVQINSLHGQGIDRLADGLVVEATAPDGTIEAVTHSTTPGWMLAVQWHAEVQPGAYPLHEAIFRAFGAACIAFLKGRTT
ncbi:MAG: gamma-glutamyl-gamma-aminobutyrate hydrolase family protein [Minwuia sp.]|nr:gamma-glutamyl-gamma-aminobutyrate hydrolase family protein [Minwuia sp.]